MFTGNLCSVILEAEADLMESVCWLTIDECTDVSIRQLEYTQCEGLWLTFRGERIAPEWGFEISRHIQEVSFLD